MNPKRRACARDECMRIRQERDVVIKMLGHCQEQRDDAWRRYEAVQQESARLAIELRRASIRSPLEAQLEKLEKLLKQLRMGKKRKVRR
jgi:hypothetical protein